MAELTVQTTDENGGLTYAAATSGDGDTFPNDGRTLLVVHNGSGGSITVTVDAQVTEARVQHLGEVTKAAGGGTVAAGVTQVFGPFAERAFNDATGMCEVTYSSAASVTVAAIRLPN